MMANPSLSSTNIAAPQQMTPGKIITVPGIPGHFIQVETSLVCLHHKAEMKVVNSPLTVIVSDGTQQSDPGAGCSTGPAPGGEW